MLYICPPIISVSDPVYLSSTALTVLMLSLPSVYEIYLLSAALPLPGEIPALVYWPAVVQKADVVRSCLPAEGRVQAGIVAEAVPFGVELYADF